MGHDADAEVMDRTVLEYGLGVVEVSTREAELEDIFVSLTGSQKNPHAQP